MVSRPIEDSVTFTTARTFEDVANVWLAGA